MTDNFDSLMDSLNATIDGMMETTSKKNSMDNSVETKSEKIKKRSPRESGERKHKEKKKENKTKQEENKKKEEEEDGDILIRELANMKRERGKKLERRRKKRVKISTESKAALHHLPMDNLGLYRSRREQLKKSEDNNNNNKLEENSENSKAKKKEEIENSGTEEDDDYDESFDEDINDVVEHKAIEILVEEKPAENTKNHSKNQNVKQRVPKNRLNRSLTNGDSENRVNKGKKSLRRTKSIVETNKKIQIILGYQTKFQVMLESSWKTELFKRFLQQKHADIIFEFYLSIEAFKKEIRSYKKQIRNDSPKKEEILGKKVKFGEKAVEICKKFGNDPTFPRKLQLILHDLVIPFIKSFLLSIRLQLSSLDRSASEFSSVDFESFSLESFSESQDDDLSDVFSFSSDVDSEIEDFLSPTLSDNQMLILDTTDPKLLKSSFSFPSFLLLSPLFSFLFFPFPLLPSLFLHSYFLFLRIPIFLVKVLLHSLRAATIFYQSLLYLFSLCQFQSTLFFPVFKKEETLPSPGFLSSPVSFLHLSFSIRFFCLLPPPFVSFSLPLGL